MEVLYPRCCGLDAHKSSITACVLLAQPGKPLKHIRRFGCRVLSEIRLIASVDRAPEGETNSSCKATLSDLGTNSSFISSSRPGAQESS